MPIRTQIVGWGGYLPRKVVTNNDLSEKLDTSDEWIYSRTGIKQRHIAAEGEVSSDLATIAAQRALAKAEMTPDDVDMIILATVTPDNTFPATAARVQAKLGMTRGVAFDIGAACAGFIYAASQAKNYIETGYAKTVLVIGVETFSRIIDWDDRRTAVLFGDGAGAVVFKGVEDNGDALSRGIISYEIHTDGRLYDILRTQGGPSETRTVGTLTMDGREVFRHAVGKLVDVAESLLKKANVTIDDIDWVIPHQANARIISATGERLGISPEKTAITVDKHANTSAASIPLALMEMGDKIKPGDLVFIEALGAGLVWGGMLIRW
ncbi:MAG: ketoacyl-ACP synthase III [Alphaproteobacteria bacterium]|nr:ketoacyl-ACP synthase III [Alphaproteobacteria bacterium]